VVIYAQNIFSNNPELRKIYTFEYERMSDSLLPYLNNENHIYHYNAIKSVASVQDTGFANQLIFLLGNEKVDSMKVVLINSLSQLDCHSSFKALINYHSNCTLSQVKSVCLSAIGKVSKTDVTELYVHSFLTNQQPDKIFISAWLKGLYLAKRRKNIDLSKNNMQLLNLLDSIVAKNLGNMDEVNFYYSKLYNKPLAEGIESIKTNPKNKQEIDEALKKLSSPYLQLDAIKKYNLSDLLCKAYIFSDEHPLIRAYALDNFLTNHTWNNKIDAPFIQSILDEMDVSLISRLCEFLILEQQQKKIIPVGIDVFKNTQRQLYLPRDFETWIDLQKVILGYDDKEYQYQSCFENGYKNPIDWEYIIKIPESQKVKITTNKGSMILLLKVNESPASVANFVKLVDQGYYNGKYFHRMVPNFVVQGGCPRGDGYGSLEWNQRSELSGHSTYKKGSVGLASVGKDSEGVQFFISHNLAPHLDGRYTIFAEVIQGLNVIENLIVGDKIMSIEKI
jgi:cyclophilin family peptidyl-prolyl cis-trans isomerase